MWGRTHQNINGSFSRCYQNKSNKLPCIIKAMDYLFDTRIEFTLY